ncbi:DUF1905 domain-containing protein [Hymenobacter sp. B81]|uniref:DUF1905 domain-containing protein n=1 Tax=Hymenobacter sp. B81 TaxID=3344878 RepID=UPI0037DD88F5
MIPDPASSKLFDGRVTLERFAGKGGWTYAPLPPLPPLPATPFGLLKVSGRIDALPLPPATLMPLGQGRKFLPLNAALRRQLGKQAGDEVHLLLFADQPVEEVSEADLHDCLADVPGALAAYQLLAEAPQRAWLGWVRAGADDAARVARLRTAAEQLAAGRQRPPGA